MNYVVYLRTTFDSYHEVITALLLGRPQKFGERRLVYSSDVGLGLGLGLGFGVLEPWI